MSMKAIQEMTGYSHSTISRAINGKGKEYRISDETVRKILEAADKLDYRPNMLARSLRLKKTMTIGLIVSDIQNPFFGELGSGIEQELRRHGYSTILCNANEVPENEEFYLRILVDRKVDGIIFVPILTEEWTYLDQLGRSMPVVLIDRIFYHTELPWVTSENTRAAEAVTEKFIALGHTRIAFLGGTRDTYINAVRFQGFRMALENHGLKPDPKLVFQVGYSTLAGREMMALALKRDPQLQAVFCVNNQVFLGAMPIVQRSEMDGGPRILMAGFDIGAYVDIFKRPLLSANQDVETIGKTAVGLILDRINDRPSEKSHVIVPIAVEAHRLEAPHP